MIPFLPSWKWKMDRSNSSYPFQIQPFSASTIMGESVFRPPSPRIASSSESARDSALKATLPWHIRPYPMQCGSLSPWIFFWRLLQLYHSCYWSSLVWFKALTNDDVIGCCCYPIIGYERQSLKFIQFEFIHKLLERSEHLRLTIVRCSFSATADIH